ncbi:hypothetical protein ABFS82_08G164600 [Erythranthe guttata]|uniref:WPP domain-containing protein n=1 Tax=Erythranthe guttata TaxID=4155 RepID=A0A022R0I2_ERYGU|nr:PREDICTED: WPP domain-interacting protein 1-like [Erythranthe guttata]EYU33751.1 hypothetical protein MIMGU_mgv1a005542mg [Erythranthe guttata]|eukprot:XP_012841845.1 PREDICTED: WPP domain-interacting protein 1-like [Erythranthe guttata]
MDLESDSSVLVNDSEEVQVNGFCGVENNDHSNLLSGVNGEEVIKDSDSVSSPPTGVKSEVSPSPTKVRKGYGLKKWRRIRRDLSNGGESSEDISKAETRELQHSVVNPSKRMQFYADRPQKSEDSVSSTNAVIGGLDVFALLGDSGLAIGQSVDAGTDSENSEDRSSKSSTAASLPKVKREVPVVVGFPQMRSLGGKNLTHSVNRGGQQGKGRIEVIKKAKGERVKIEKENSLSSMESDSRSSNFVFSQGTHATSNGVKSEREVPYNGENGDGVHLSRDGEGGYEEISPEDGVADLSWEVKKDRNENDGSSSEQDPLVESIFLLQTVQEALEKEVLKFKEIEIDASIDDSDPDTDTRQSELGETEKRVYEAELEELFKQRIEAEVEYLAISRTVQNLRAASANPNTISKEQKAEDLMINNEAEKLEMFSDDIASADETMKLQKRVFKYTIFFLVQILSFLIILKVLVFELSQNSVEFVPT